MKKPTVKYLRNKCDSLLTPIIKLLSPKCLLCGHDTEVAHHHVHKSKSSALRYVIENLIPLCNSCHLKLHMNESYWASKIVEIRGLKWFQGLEKIKNTIVKTDILFYKEWYEKLSNLLVKINKDKFDVPVDK